MLIKKSEAKEKKNSGSCTVLEYDFPLGKLGFATAEISGRYPEKGVAWNEKCDELYYILSGKGKIQCGGKIYELNPGDAFLILSGKKYFVEGNLIIALSSGPSWSPEQYKMED